jgi:hypothetical protein
MTEPEILRALQALAASDREVEAPPEVEDRLRLAFRQKSAQRKWRIRAAWAVAAAAAIAILAIGTRQNRPVQPVEVVKRSPEAIQPAAAGVQTAVQTAAPGAPRRTARIRRAPENQEVMTDFFSLQDDAAPIERGELLRVSLPAAAMRTVGLPVREDRLSERVQADVLMSEEGVATAIRFVKYSGEK